MAKGTIHNKAIEALVAELLGASVPEGATVVGVEVLAPGLKEEVGPGLAVVVVGLPAFVVVVALLDVLGAAGTVGAFVVVVGAAGALDDVLGAGGTGATGLLVVVVVVVVGAADPPKTT